MIRPSVKRPVLASVLLALCFFVSLNACTTAPTLRETLASIPEKNLAFYGFDPASALVDRIGVPPESLVSLWRSFDGDASYRAHTPSASEIDQLGKVFEALPPKHREVLEQRLVSVFCIEGFHGSGTADYVLDSDDRLYSILILNPAVFGESASELLTRRANTAFEDDGSGLSLSVFAPPDVSGLAYIVLHEATHMVDYVERYTPYVEPGMLELYGRSGRKTPFTDEYWSGYAELKPEWAIAGLEDLSYYGLGSAIPISRAPALYEALAHTGIVSLYGASNWAEDFAEYVAFHHLVGEHGAGYEIRIERDSEVVFSYTPMASPLAVERAGLLDPDLL